MTLHSSRWLQPFRNRPDSEHVQALVRLIIACLILAYLGALQAYAGPALDVQPMVLIMLAEAVVGLGIVASIAFDPGVSHVRRWLGMLADYATLATLMTLKAEELAPLYVLILWVTIGNGLRYGTHYLHAASTLAAASFLSVVWFGDFWRDHVYLAGGLGVGLIAIPMYLSSLLKDLHSATEEAKRANAAKSRFLANMSHEFRSPLNGIIGMAELLTGTRLAPDQRESAEVIYTSAQTLLLLVDDVLDISAIEAGKLQRKDADFNLHDLVHRLQKMLQPHAAGKGLLLKATIDDDVPVRVHGDGAHLTQILLNLMHNAVKFTEQGEVALKVSNQGGSELAPLLRFSVRDTGIGISAEDKERIFRAFEQVDMGPTRRFGGTGLGTTIAKTLTQLLGGQIGLEDNPGGGSHFWVELPMRVQEPGAASPESESGKVVSFDDPFIRHKARVRSLRVLVADDQHANRVVLTRILERAGHKVTAVNDGEEALDALEIGNIDIAILDMHMPHLTGLDVIRQLRFMQAGGKSTPVIVLSADATVQAVKDAEAAGAPAYLTKPVVVGKLLETIADLISPQKLPGVRPVTDVARPMVNPAVLQELAAMNLGESFLRDFVEQCLKDASGCLAELSRAGSLRAWEDFREAAHAFKGVAENMGAQILAERCMQIMRANDEALAREQRKLVSELTSQLTVVAEQTRSEVARLIQAENGNSGRGSSPDNN